MAKDVKKKAAAKPVAKKPAKKLAIKKKAALPLPATLQPPAAAPAAKPRKSVKQAEARHLAPLEVPATGDVDVLRRLWDTIEGRRVSGDTTISTRRACWRAAPPRWRRSWARKRWNA
ncbi:hypothetical protein ACFQU7_21105 [Pseudoroseomonas wenyumeiae]